MGPKVKPHLEGRSKAERKATRAQLGPLRQLTVQPKTRERYTKAIHRFHSYLREQEITLPRQRHLLDPIVSDYLEALWSQGEARSLASDTLAGLQDCDPHLKGNLVYSWRLLKTWVSNDIPARAPPNDGTGSPNPSWPFSFFW